MKGPPPSFTEDGEPLIYHRLTGLAAQLAPNTPAVGDAAYLTRTDTKLVPWSERAQDDGDEPAELYGLDPLDVAAGDGGGVFMSPGAPVSIAWVKKSIARAPGLAFRLSDLESLGRVTVRPADLQTYYQRVFVGDVSRADDVIRRDLHVYDQLDAYYPLTDALHLIRESIESDDARAATYAVARNRAASFDRAEQLLADPSFQAQLARAAEQLLDFAAGWVDAAAVEDLTEAALEGVLELYRGEIIEGVVAGSAAWRSPSLAREAEVLVWAPVPCELAVLAFDSATWTWVDPAGCGRVRTGGLLIAAGR